MKPSVTFFTVTHYKDYDFLLGSIEHHSEMGYHLVLDTSPREHAIAPSGLPETVRWIHEPLYGSGWKQFKMRTAVERALLLAREFGTDILASLDSDEFYSRDSSELLFPHVARGPVSVHCTHWKSDGLPYMFGKSEWHLRLWPRDCEVQIAANVDWTKHAQYNGNPEHHPVPVPPAARPEVRVPGNFHHHVHYAFSPDFNSDAGARMIDGWPDGGARVPLVEWPIKLRMWQAAGIRPSRYYMALENERNA